MKFWRGLLIQPLFEAQCVRVTREHRKDSQGKIGTAECVELQNALSPRAKRNREAKKKR